MTEYENQAKKLWGDTPAYREYEEKTKGYTQADHIEGENKGFHICGWYNISSAGYIPAGSGFQRA